MPKISFSNKMSEEVDSSGLDDIVQQSMCSTTNSSHNSDDSCVDIADNRGNNFNGSDSGNYTVPEFELNRTKVAVLSIIIILTVLGNICVILAIFLRKMKMTRMYYFILHLSLADLLTAFFTLLPELCWTFTWPNFYGGGALCKIVKYLQMIGPYLSSYVLIMTAIDRFQAICYPLSNCTWTPKRSNIMIFVAWVVSLLLCIPQAVIFGQSEVGPYCVANFPPVWGVKAYVTWFAISNFFIPFVVLVYCYGRICHAIWDNFNSKTKERSEQNQDGESTMMTRLRSSLRRPQKVRLRWQSNLRSSTTQQHQQRRWEEEEEEEEEEQNQAMITVEPPSNEATTSSHHSNNLIQTTSFSIARRQSDDDCGSESPPSSMGHRKSSSSIVAVSGRPSSTAPNPRSHSVKGISRAKIKTVKLTVVVIVGYILCSAPFICVQLWTAWDEEAAERVSASMQWLYWLLTLNSVVNPWIYMFFNVNLVESLYRACCCCDPVVMGSRRGGGGGGGQRGHLLLGGSRNQATLTTTRNGTMTTGISANNSCNKLDAPLQRSRSNTGGSNASYTVVTTCRD